MKPQLKWQMMSGGAKHDFPFPKPKIFASVILQVDQIVYGVQFLGSVHIDEIAGFGI